jgi:hypothetical protein
MSRLSLALRTSPLSGQEGKTMKEKIIWASIGVVVGLVFANQIKSLPLVNKIPQV